MPLNWTAYDRYFADPKRDRQPMGDEVKRALEAESTALLQLPPEETTEVWGECTLPGCFGMVIHLPSHRLHRWNPDRNQAFGLKIFHGDSFGMQGKKLVHFHAKDRAKYPCLPRPQVQHVYGGGRFCSTLPGEKEPRWYLIQEWVEGETWDEVLKRPTLNPEQAVKLLESLFDGIIFPLWSAGVIWWDIRSNNYCVRSAESGLEVVMIDTDSLQAYSDEILNRPTDHQQRDAKKGTGVKRLKTMIYALADTVAKNLNVGRAPRQVKRDTEAHVESFLQVMRQPGALNSEAAREALKRMVIFLTKETWVRRS